MGSTTEQAAKKQRLPFATPFYYGWLMVGISALGIFFSGPGQTYSNSVFIEFYIEDFQLSRTAVSGIYSLATLIAGFLLFGIGKLTDRLGRRIMLTAVAFMLGVACIWNSYITGVAMMLIGFFCVRLFGQGSMTLIPNTLVSQWFVKRRGRALSFAGLGGLVGAAFFPPFINELITVYDWQTAWRVLGIMLIVLFVPIAYYFVRNKPEDVGLLPDYVSTHAEKPVTMEEEISWTLAQAVKTRSFWLLLVCMAIPAMIYTGLTFQLFSILGDYDIDRTTIAFLLSLVPMISFGFSLVSGFVVEKVRAHGMLGLTFLLNIAAPLILLFLQGGYIGVLLFAVAWGAAQGLMNIPLSIVWPNYFGRQHLGSIQSITTAATVVGSALGPIAFGLAYDQLGSYRMILIISAIIWLIGALLAFISPPPTLKPHTNGN